MLDLSLPVPGAESMGGNDVVVSMHSIRCSINDSHVAPAMVTEVFTSALARASQANHLKKDSGPRLVRRADFMARALQIGNL